MSSELSTGPSERGRLGLRWLVGLTLFALAVRFVGLNYDQNHHFHPDERAIADAISRLSFDPRDPQLNPKFFAYGSFPLYVFGLAASTLSNIPGLRGYDESILIGRGVSAVAGTLTVLLIAIIGSRLYDRRVGLLAGFLLGACVLHVQNSHFMTTDVFLTLMVLLALYFLLGLVRQGHTADYLLAGLTIGFAGATKFSAMPLLAPLGVAILVRMYREGRFAPVAFKAVLALLAIGLAFFVGQPYALLDFETFRRHIDEQSNMVRNAGLLPYTNQYIGVPKYLYEMQEIVLWCMGPALGLVALWATATRTVKAVREGSGEQLVLLSWVLPYFAVTGWFDVKFVRYLLPIYPFLILWAAAWLIDWYDRSRLGRVALWTVVGTTLLYLLAFLSIYQRDHTAVTGSDWVYKHVPKGSLLLTQHWDEGFPFHLPGRPRADIEVEELPYYDGEHKMKLIAEKLAEADFLALQTKRLYGAVTRTPEKYRLTNNYFYLLFAGDLGYKLVYDHASRPGLFGIELPDELADESITVYDHPKVLIFENVERLEAGEIFERVKRGIPSRKLDRTDLLLARADAVEGEEAAPAAPIRSSWNALLRFALLVEILGFAAYQLLHRVLPVSGAYALSKVLGVLFFAYVPWLLTSVGLTEFRGSTLNLVALLLVLAALPAWRAAGRERMPAELWPTELLFWGTFGFFLIVRAFNPEVFWGEKPMDFSFLNTLHRSVRLPPPEPWFAGSTLHYSYFGHYVVAALGKACHIHPGVVFNLGVALVAGLTAAAAFAAGCALGGRWRVGLLAAAFTTLFGNLAGPRNVLDRLSRDSSFSDLFNFDYFWATSRVIKDTINEYPFWSFLFADLHAHALVMPFSLSFLALAIWWVRRDESPRPIRLPALILLLGLSLGAIMVTNTWSTFVYAAFFPFLLGTTSIARGRLGRGQVVGVFVLIALVLGAVALQQLAPADARRIEDSLRFFGEDMRPFDAIQLAGLGLAAALLVPGTVFASIVLFGLAYLFYYPYWRDWSAPSRNWGLEGDAFANAYDFWTIFGLFLWVALPFLFAFWRRQLQGDRDRLDAPRRVSVWLVGGAIFACFALTLPWSRLFESGQQFVYFLRLGTLRGPTFSYEIAPLASIRSALVLLAVLALHLGLSRSAPPRRRTVAALLSFAFFVTAGVDVVHVWDRMNTVFKFYLESWFVFSVACAAAVYELRAGMIRSPRLFLLWRLGYGFLLLIAAFTALTATRGVIGTKRVPTPRPTLDGTAYLAMRDPHENASYEWINREIGGIPVIAEAYGPSYQEFARVSMNTGLPTVLGWDYHVHQRAHAWPDINRRKEDLKKLYTTESDAVAREVLKTYHVALVYVGKLERREYNGGNLTRFKEWANLLTPVYENAGVSIFAVQGQFSGATPIQTIEDVPAIAGEAAEEGEGGAPPAQSPAGQLTQPRGLDLDAAGNVYVADFGNDRVQVYDSKLVFARGWGNKGNLPGEFKQPGDVSIAPSGTVYVADTWNQRVQAFKPDGTYLFEFGNGLFGPRGIAIDASGTIFLVDTGNHRVRRFSANGAEEASWGGLGEEEGKFKEPVGVAVDADGLVYVCDTGNGRVQIFDRDGKLKSTFAIDGWELKVFSEPHIVVGTSGVIWVTVPTERVVRAYDREGNLLHEIAGGEERGSIFQRAMGIAFVSPEELIVSDLEGRIVRLPIPPEAR